MYFYWERQLFNCKLDSEMKRILFLIFIGLFVSCSPGKRTYSYVKNNDLSITRKYIGNFLDYSHTGPEVFGGVHLIWIRTTQFNSFGKISAYGKDCRFSVGDKIYIKRLYSTPGPDGSWEYQIENDSSVVYRLSKYRYENNVLVQALF
jgi:hypothetical protein